MPDLLITLVVLPKTIRLFFQTSYNHSMISLAITVIGDFTAGMKVVME
jgi:vesicle coat complex subunit